MSTKPGGDAPAPKPNAPEQQELKAPDIQQARSARGEDLKKTEASRTNASDGSLRDRSKLIAEQEESIQIMGAGGLIASRRNRLTEGDLAAKDPGKSSINVRELLAKPEPEAKSLVEEFGRAAGMPAGAARDAALANVQQLADKTYNRGEFANQSGESAPPVSDKIQVDGRFDDRNQIIASNDMLLDVKSDAINAGPVETDKDKIIPKPYEKTASNLIKAGLDYNTETVPVSQKLAAFASSATARLLDPASRQAYFQGMLDETLGIGEGLNIAKEEVKNGAQTAAGKAWTAICDGSVSNFMAKPNAINEPLFKTISSCLDAMSRDPNAVNNVLTVMGRELQSASDKYSKMSPHDRGVQDGKAIFFFVNPEGSTEAADLALKAGQRVAPRAGEVIGAGAVRVGEFGVDLVASAKNTARTFDQATQDFMQGGRPQYATAGGSSEFFGNPASLNPGQPTDINFMTKADDLGGGMERQPGQKRPGWDLTNKSNPENILNPIDRKANVEEKVGQLVRLSKENDPLIREFTQKIDSKLGTSSTPPNFKAPEDIAFKAKRPNILEDKPWFDVEHVRDSLRFKTVASDLRDLPSIIKELKASKFEIVDAQLEKLVEPKGRGWRMAAIDLRAPNGQIIEYQILPPEMNEAGKIEHAAYKGWREKDIASLTAAEKLARDEAEQNAVKMYKAAWNAYLTRTGQTNQEIEDIISEGFRQCNKAR